MLDIEQVKKDLMDVCRDSSYTYVHDIGNSAIALICDLQDRLQAAESELARLPAKWSEDSSLKSWFPLTAGMYDRTLIENENLRNEIKQLQSKLDELHKQPVAHYLRYESDGKATVWPEQVADSEPYYSGPVVVEQEHVAEVAISLKTADLCAHLNGNGYKSLKSGDRLYAKPVPAEPVHEITDEKGRPMTYWGGKATQPAQAVAIPEKIKPATRTLESFGYANGWNDCVDSITTE